MTTGLSSEFEKYYNFFKVIDLLHYGAAKNRDKPGYSDISYPDVLVSAMTYINDNLSYPITVSEISQKVNVSVNTLERYFMRFLNVSPTSYIRKKRLSNAAKLLSWGYSVTEASEKSGFSNCSGFISLFKNTFGQTPLAYKKSLNTL